MKSPRQSIMSLLMLFLPPTTTLLLTSTSTFHLVHAATSKKKKQPIHVAQKNLCLGRPAITRKHEGTLQWLYKNIGETQIVSQTTPQHEAACWMFRNSKFSAQRYAMAVVYYATAGAKWEVSTNWMTSKHECDWYGVTCNAFRQVVDLSLGYIELEGLIPREIGLLKELRDIDLHGNDLQGVIPHKLMVGNTKLEYLRMQMNGLFGAIHKEITNLKGLRELYLYGNYIAGTIPKDMQKLKHLEHIDLYANQLSGTIPSELAKLPKLRYLDVHDNNLHGTMPKEICAMKLDELVADCHGRNPEVQCDCCTVCCQGLPAMVCVDQKTGKAVDRLF